MSDFSSSQPRPLRIAQPSSQPQPPLQHGLPTPPSSPRKRRRILRESEDASGELAIEDYLYRTDRYRSTTESQPPPLPIIRSTPDLATLEEFRTIWPAVIEKLDSVMKGQYTCHICDSWKQGCYQENHKVTTCLVQLDRDPGVSPSWATIRNEIHSLLQRSGFKSVQVELLDPHKAFIPALFPQPPSTGSIRLYESVRDRLAALLFRFLGMSWVSMSLYRLGSSKNSAVPTIVVFVRPFTYCDWQHLEVVMNDVVKSKLPEGRTLGIEYLPGGVSNDNDRLSASHYSMHPGLGASIGVEKIDSTGTMGGFVNLKVGSKIHFGFLTNHHVAAARAKDQEKASAAKPADASQLDIVGFEYSQDTEARPRIMCPSENDRLAWRQEVTTQIEDMQKGLDHFEEQQRAMAEAGMPVHRGAEKTRQGYLTVLKLLQEELATVDNLPMNVGRPLVSSGAAISQDRSIIDWAFVEMPLALHETLQREGQYVNRLPSARHKSLKKAGFPEGKYSWAVVVPDARTPDEVSFCAVKFGAMEKGHRYFKQGRTSAITVGECNGTETELNQIDHVRYDEDGKKHHMKETTARQLVILSMEREGDQKTEFSKPGDSGSFIIDGSGRVCGLLYGEHTGFCDKRYEVGAGLVTCMTDVLASVGRKTTSWNDKGEETKGQLFLADPYPKSTE